MKRIIIGLISIAFFSHFGISQQGTFPKGKVIESLKIKSKILNKEVSYSVYLPPDYESSQRSYPVVYLLHGYSDNETGWVQFGQANQVADKGIQTGEIPPMIIIMPDAEVTFYINNHNNTIRYEDFFFAEFIPFIEDTYRIRKKKEFRAVSGLSMGGYGALVFAMHHPDMFAACAPLSAAIRTDFEIINMQTPERRERFIQLYGKQKGDSPITDHYRKNSPLHMAETMDEEILNSVRWYIDCGDDDFLYRGNSTMHITLNSRKIKHEYRVRDGGHTWQYWRTGLYDALVFIGWSFHR